MSHTEAMVSPSRRYVVVEHRKTGIVSTFEKGLLRGNSLPTKKNPSHYKLLFESRSMREAVLFERAHKGCSTHL
jgi:hypothetical protein